MPNHCRGGEEVLLIGSKSPKDTANGKSGHLGSTQGSVIGLHINPDLNFLVYKIDKYLSLERPANIQDSLK